MRVTVSVAEQSVAQFVRLSNDTQVMNELSFSDNQAINDVSTD